MPDLTELSQRELEILKLVATGASNKEIAQQLYISANTVKVHLRNIFAKIGANSRTEAAMYAVANHLVEGVLPEAQASDGGGGVGRGPVSNANQPGGLADSAAGGNIAPLRFAGLNLRFFLAVLGLILVISGAIVATNLARTPSAGELPGAQAAGTLQPRWVNMATMPVGRAKMAVAVYDNKILAIAGSGEQGVSGAVEHFDPLENRWVDLASKPTPVSGVEAAVVGGRVYVPGGVLASGELTDLVEVYDPGKDRWEQVDRLPKPLSDYAMTAFEGSLYLFGGWDGSEYSAAVYRYEPQQDRWTQVGEMDQPRSEAAAVVRGEKIYIAGGRNDQGLLAGCVIYQPNYSEQGEDAWEVAPPLPDARAGLGLTSIADILYAIGGESESQAGTVDSFALLPQDHRWQVFDIADAPFPIDAGMTSVGRNLYVFGGRDGKDLSKKNSTYQVLYTISIPVLVK